MSLLHSIKAIGQTHGRSLSSPSTGRELPVYPDGTDRTETGSAAPFFHLEFNDVAHAALERVAEVTLMLAKHRPVVVVEFFDDLERPPPIEHVAAGRVISLRARSPSD
jgi:hypothetical protein